MKYNFDEIIDRRNSDSHKWKNIKELYGDDEILPMWIADMDFKAPQEVIDALRDRVEHGVFGYIERSDSFYDAVINWVKKRFNWDIKKEWILFTPGVVAGFNIGVRELTKEGDSVLVQPPVYPPFFRVLENNNRVSNENPLIHNGQGYTIDFDHLEKNIGDSRLFMFCNPHNPVGRVWTKEELERLGQICLDNDVIIISDEIHSDFVFKDKTHTPMATISKEIEDRTITLMAPSKTFNIAGLVTSVAIIPNDELREVYCKAIEAMEIDSTSIFGALGLEVAYNHGEEWLEQILLYIEDNVDFALGYIRENIPQIKADKPDGTFLLWLDFNEIDKTADEIEEALLKIGKVALNDGRPYGQGADKFFRFNLGCPRSTLEEGLRRIEKTVKALI